jgi:RNA polymerase-binding transcription factor DksA
MDENQFEQADRLTTAAIESGIERARRKRPPPEGFDGTCAGCGTDVPPQRISMSLYNCVECQSTIERRLKIFHQR